MAIIAHVSAFDLAADLVDQEAVNAELQEEIDRLVEATRNMLTTDGFY